MRLIWILSTALVAACGTEIDAPADTATESIPVSEGTDTPADQPALAFEGYDNTWHISNGWPGEYPPGFTVLEAGVSVLGREVMAIDAPVDQACLLPQYANYTPWNGTRRETDALNFLTASKRTNVIFPTGASLTGLSGYPETIETALEIPAGKALTYLTYIAEGFALIEYDGQQYEVNEQEFPQDTAFDQADARTDLWVEVACTDSTRVWLRLSDLKGTLGLGETEYTEFGNAADLVP